MLVQSNTNQPNQQPKEFKLNPETTQLCALWCGYLYGIMDLPWGTIVFILTAILTVLKTAFLLREKYKAWKKGEL